MLKHLWVQLFPVNLECLEGIWLLNLRLNHHLVHPDPLGFRLIKQLCKWMKQSISRLKILCTRFCTQFVQECKLILECKSTLNAMSCECKWDLSANQFWVQLVVSANEIWVQMRFECKWVVSANELWVQISFEFKMNEVSASEIWVQWDLRQWDLSAIEL